MNGRKWREIARKRLLFVSGISLCFRPFVLTYGFKLFYCLNFLFHFSLFVFYRPISYCPVWCHPLSCCLVVQFLVRFCESPVNLFSHILYSLLRLKGFVVLLLIVEWIFCDHCSLDRNKCLMKINSAIYTKLWRLSALV